MSGWHRYYGSTTVNCDQVGVYGPPVAFSVFAFLQHGRRMLPLALKRRINRIGLAGLDNEELRTALAAVSPGTFLDIDPLAPPPLQGVIVGWRRLEPEIAGDSHSVAYPGLGLDKLGYCTDLALTLRILARCEGGLYLGHRTPSGSLTELAVRRLIFDDPRLARLSCVGPVPPKHWPLLEKEVAAKAAERAARRARTKSSKRPFRAGRRGRRSAP